MSLYPIKYRTRVVYPSMFEGDEYKDFEIYATNRTEAVQLTKELFSVLDGGSIQKIGCKPIIPDEDTGIKVLKEWKSAINKLDEDLFGKTYPDMLELFIKYEGFCAEFAGDSLISFKFNLLNLTLKVMLYNGGIVVDKSYGYYRDILNNAYVIIDDVVYMSK